MISFHSAQNVGCAGYSGGKHIRCPRHWRHIWCIDRSRRGDWTSDAAIIIWTIVAAAAGSLQWRSSLLDIFFSHTLTWHSSINVNNNNGSYISAKKSKEFRQIVKYRTSTCCNENHHTPRQYSGIITGNNFKIQLYSIVHRRLWSSDNSKCTMSIISTNSHISDGPLNAARQQL